MPVKQPLSIKQEAYARFYVELQDDGLAYDRAYLPLTSDPASYNKKGKAIRNNPKVAKRIRELQDDAAMRAGITATAIINKTWKIIQKAEDKNQYAAALKGLDQLSRTLGMYKDSIEITGKLSVDQIAQEIHHRAITEGWDVEGEFYDITDEGSTEGSHEELAEPELLHGELSGGEEDIPEADRDDAGNTGE